MLDNKYRKPHKINIIESTYKYYLLLLIPAVRGFFVYGQGVYEWFKGAWFDLLILFLIFLFGYANWFFYTYKITPHGIYISRGILIWKKKYIPFCNISALNIEYPFHWKIIGAAKVRIDTDAGSQKKFDIVITMRKKEALFLSELIKIKVENKENTKKIYIPKRINIIILSILTSKSFTGIIFLVTLISQGGKILGREFEELIYSSITDIAKKLAFGIPPAAAVIVYIIAGGWFAAFLIRLVRYKNFTVTRRNKNLYITGGGITKREYCIDTEKINFLEISQSLITKFFNIFSVYINVSGYGKEKNSINMLIPVAIKKELNTNLKLLLPEINVGNIKTKPPKAAIWGFIGTPVFFIIFTGTAGALLYYIFFNFSSFVLFTAIMFEISFIWFLIHRAVSFSHTGIGMSGGIYTLSYTRKFNICTVAVPGHKIVKIEIKQNPLQQMNGYCNIIFYTFSKRAAKHTIRNIKYSEAEVLINNQ